MTHRDRPDFGPGICRIPRAPGKVSDKALCPVFAADPRAGCACYGACIRDMTEDELRIEAERAKAPRGGGEG